MDYKVGTGTITTLKWLNIFNLISLIFTLVVLSFVGISAIGFENAFLTIVITSILTVGAFFFTYWAKNKFIANATKSNLYIAIAANVLGMFLLNRIVSIGNLIAYFRVMFVDRVEE